LEPGRSHGESTSGYDGVAHEILAPSGSGVQPQPNAWVLWDGWGWSRWVGSWWRMGASVSDAVHSAPVQSQQEEAWQECEGSSARWESVGPRPSSGLDGPAHSGRLESRRLKQSMCVGPVV